MVFETGFNTNFLYSVAILQSIHQMTLIKGGKKIEKLDLGQISVSLENFDTDTETIIVLLNYSLLMVQFRLHYQKLQIRNKLEKVIFIC
jgi:hypothetical protein